jgi:hypothetical protein
VILPVIDCLHSSLRHAGCLLQREKSFKKSSLTASQCSGNGVGACVQMHCKITGSRKRARPADRDGWCAGRYPSAGSQMGFR